MWQSRIRNNDFTYFRRLVNTQKYDLRSLSRLFPFFSAPTVASDFGLNPFERACLYNVALERVFVYAARGCIWKFSIKIERDWKWWKCEVAKTNFSAQCAIIASTTTTGNLVLLTASFPPCDPPGNCCGMRCQMPNAAAGAAIIQNFIYGKSSGRQQELLVSVS